MFHVLHITYAAPRSRTWGLPCPRSSHPARLLEATGKFLGSSSAAGANVFLGVDSFSILFNHRSFQEPAVSPAVLMAFWKEGSLERMGKCPLEFLEMSRASHTE